MSRTIDFVQVVECLYPEMMILLNCSKAASPKIVLTLVLEGFWMGRRVEVGRSQSVLGLGCLSLRREGEGGERGEGGGGGGGEGEGWGEGCGEGGGEGRGAVKNRNFTQG